MTTPESSIPAAGQHRYAVLLVDDQPVVRDGLVDLISREPDFSVAAQAGNAAQAKQALAKLQPEVMLIELALPDCHGLEFIKDIRAQSDTPRILVYSRHQEDVYALRAVRAGAQGYVMKNQPVSRLLEALRTVAEGHFAVSLDVSAGFLNGFAPVVESQAAASLGALTDRELEVFEMIGRGAGTRQIASYLNRSTSAVETCRIRIKKKLGLSHCAELVSRAVRWVEHRQWSVDLETVEDETGDDMADLGLTAG